MKFTTVLAVLATVATAVSASFSVGQLETNAKRFAAGMGPLPPYRRSSTPSYGSPKYKPSNTPQDSYSCNSGSMQCCESVSSTAESNCRSKVEGYSGLNVDPSVPVGLTCSPLSSSGLSSGACTSQKVCCENNNYNGVVAIGCTPINGNSNSPGNADVYTPVEGYSNSPGNGYGNSPGNGYGGGGNSYGNSYGGSGNSYGGSGNSYGNSGKDSIKGYSNSGNEYSNSGNGYGNSPGNSYGGSGNSYGNSGKDSIKGYSNSGNEYGNSGNGYSNTPGKGYGGKGYGDTPSKGYGGTPGKGYA